VSSSCARAQEQRAANASALVLAALAAFFGVLLWAVRNNPGVIRQAKLDYDATGRRRFHLRRAGVFVVRGINISPSIFLAPPP
jgi:hypothetical protein